MYFNLLISGCLISVFFVYFGVNNTELFTVLTPEQLTAMISAITISLAYHLIKSITASRAKNWPSVTGRILYVTRKKEQFIERFQIVYSYEIKGVKYRGDRFDMVSNYAKYGSLRRYCKIPKEELLSKDAQGRALKVFYNPELYSDCVLDNNPKLPILVTHITSYVVIMIAMYYMVSLIIDIFRNAGAI